MGDQEIYSKRNIITHGGNIKISIRHFSKKRENIRRAQNASTGHRTTKTSTWYQKPRKLWNSLIREAQYESFIDRERSSLSREGNGFKYLIGLSTLGWMLVVEVQLPISRTKSRQNTTKWASGWLIVSIMSDSHKMSRNKTDCIGRCSVLFCFFVPLRFGVISFL